MNQKMQEATNTEQMNFFAQFVSKSVKAEPSGISPLEELNLRYNPKDPNDMLELKEILGNCLSYPSSDVAYIHMNSHRLGWMDLKSSQNAQITQNGTFCPCCGFIFQQDDQNPGPTTLNVCTSLSEVNHMGISAYLYFETLKHVIALLLIMLVVFTVYSLVSNVIASDSYKKSLTTSDITPNLLSYEGFLAISLGSKQIHQTESDKTSYTVQCWLGVAMIAIWIIAFGVIKLREREGAQEVDIESKTASDFTILIKNYPSRMSKEQLERQLNEYLQHLKVQHPYKIPIRITKINMAKPFYLNQQSFENKELDQLNEKYEKYRETFIQWIKERKTQDQFSTPAAERNKIKKQFYEMREKRLKIYKQMAEKIKQQFRKRSVEETVPTFVTFQSSYNKQFLQFMHDDSKKFINRLPCFSKSKYFQFKQIGNDENVIAQILQAPEPEDVIWTNQGQSSGSYFKKRLLTYTLSALALAGSFGAIYGLSKVQSDYAKTHTDVSNQYISILISLCISIINIILQQFLRFLTKLERSPTNTQHQASLGLKAVIALLINSIAIPILVNYFFKQNLYGVNGLAYDVFYLGITNSFLSPLLKIFDGYFYFTRFWRWYKDHPTRKLELNQNQLNAISEYMEFEIGYEYIYFVNLFLFTCFFSPLQPIIVVFAIVGIFLMYWAQKYSLFYHCNRPTPGNDSINTAMYQLIYLGPAFFTIGSFCWSHFFKQSFIGIAPNVTAAALSAIVILLPFKKLIKSFKADAPQPEQFFEDDRIFMPSEYDRLNPSTSIEGIDDYKQYIYRYKQILEMKKLKQPQKFGQIMNQFQRLMGTGARNHQIIVPSVVNYFSRNANSSLDQNNIVFQQLLGSSQNVFNPFLIGQAVSDQHDPINLVVPNWLTEEEVRYQNQDTNQAILFKVVTALMPTVQIDKSGAMVLVQQMANPTHPNNVANDRGNKLPPLASGEVVKYEYEVPLMQMNMLNSLCKQTDVDKTMMGILGNNFNQLTGNNNGNNTNSMRDSRYHTRKSGQYNTIMKQLMPGNNPNPYNNNPNQNRQLPINIDLTNQIGRHLPNMMMQNDPNAQYYQNGNQYYGQPRAPFYGLPRQNGY